MQKLREFLENRQISVYFATVTLAAVIAMFVPGTTVLEAGVNPALALMLFVTFLQVPLADLWRAFIQVRFFAALLTANFVMVPLLVAVLVQFLPHDPMVLLGVLLVLLTPCIDYVVTFSHLGLRCAPAAGGNSGALDRANAVAAGLSRPVPWERCNRPCSARSVRSRVHLADCDSALTCRSCPILGSSVPNGRVGIYQARIAACASDGACPVRGHRGRSTAARACDRCGLAGDPNLYCLCSARSLPRVAGGSAVPPRRTGWPCYCIQCKHAKFARGVAARACSARSNSRAAGDHRYTNTCRVNQ